MESSSWTGVYHIDIINVLCYSFVIFLTSLDWEFGVVTRVGEGSLSLHGESTAGEERWEGESSDALGGASGVVG